MAEPDPSRSRPAPRWRSGAKGSSADWTIVQHLEMFLEVLASSSLSEAARNIRRSASSVGRSMRELEAIFGVALFERHVAGVLPTPAARVVELRAARIVHEICDAARQFADPASRTGPSLASLRYFLLNGRKLELLIELAECGMIQRAAERLSLSPSAASMALSRIEATLGAPVFDRTRHGFEPTVRGAALLDHVRRVAAELRHLAAELASQAEAIAGTIVVGTLSLARTQLFPEAVARVVTRYPAVTVKTIEVPIERMAEGIRSGDIDFLIGVAREQGTQPGLLFEPLLLDRLCLVARAANPVFTRPGLRLSDLLDQRWILPRGGSRGGRLIATAFAVEGLPAPLPAVETADLQILRQLLLTSDMLAIASPQQLLFELHAGQLREIPVGLRAGRREIGLITREGAQLSPAVLCLMDAIRDAARGMADL